MATKRQREEKRKKTVSAKKFADTHKGFDRTALNVPEGTNFFGPKKEGTYRLDIVPFTAGAGNPDADAGEMTSYRTIFVHRGVGAEGKSYCCPLKMAKARCPICEWRASQATKPNADEDTVASLAPKERQLWNIYDHNAKDRGVQIWDVSYYLFGKNLVNKIRNADEDDRYDEFADPEAGFTLKVGAEEKSMGKNSFLDFNDIEFKSREPLDADILGKALCLDDLPKILDYEELKKVFLEQPAAASKDDKKKDKGKPPPKKGKAEEDDDSEVDSEEDSSVEEESDEASEEDSEADSEEASEEDSEEDSEEASEEDSEEDSEEASEEDSEEDEASEEDSEADSEEDDDSEVEAKVPSSNGKKLPTAKEHGIKVGSVVKHKKYGQCEVTHVSGDGTSLKLEDGKGKVHGACGAEDCTLVSKPAKASSKK